MKITRDNSIIEIRRLMRKIAQNTNQYSNYLKKTYGITSPQMSIIRIINNNASVPSLSEITQEAGVHITTAEELVDKLQKRKIVKKQRNNKDRRVVGVILTAKGKKILQEAPLGGIFQFYQSLQKISDKEAQQIYNALRKVVKLFGASEAAAE